MCPFRLNRARPLLVAPCHRQVDTAPVVLDRFKVTAAAQDPVSRKMQAALYDLAESQIKVRAAQLLELRKIAQTIGREVMGSDWVIPEVGDLADLQIETDALNQELGAMLSSLGMSGRKP